MTRVDCGRGRGGTTAVVVPSGCGNHSCLSAGWVQTFTPTSPTSPTGTSSGSPGVLSFGAGGLVQVSCSDPSTCGTAAVTVGGPGTFVSNQGEYAAALSPVASVVTTATRAIFPHCTAQRWLKSLPGVGSQSVGTDPSWYSMRTLLEAPASVHLTRITLFAASDQLTCTSVGGGGAACAVVVWSAARSTATVAVATVLRMSESPR